MFRRWQKDAVDKYRTLESFNSFVSQLRPLSSHDELSACNATDLYSVLSVLHSKGRNPQLQINANPPFYYFLADAVQSDDADGAALPAGGGDGGPQAAPGFARREAVVPVSSKSTLLTMNAMAEFFKLDAHTNVSHVLIAIVDDDGSVSLIRVFNYVQPPFEGPETLPPMEAGEGGVGGESDDD